VAEEFRMPQRILLIEDDEALREALGETLSLESIDFSSFGTAEDALREIGDPGWGVLVSDIRLPRQSGLDLLFEARRVRSDLPVVLMTAYADAKTAVEALKGGARDFLLKPFTPDQFIEVVRRYLPQDDSSRLLAADGPVAVDAVSRQLIKRLDRVAQTDATVLLTGESGSGKEVMAKFIHERSSRAKFPFVPINCAAIPETLLEATLFGHERGAFTGAIKSQLGKFELAQYGTILLDEIGEMPLDLQAKLLRVLQEKQVERVGSHHTIQLDVRVLAATNQDLSKKVSKGEFREDLFYRINVFPLRIPPLRERREDILPLAERFLLRYRASMGRPESRLSEGAREVLRCHPWPGNVRELENAIQRGLLLCDGVAIEPGDLALDNTPVEPVRYSDQNSSARPSQSVSGPFEHQGDIRKLERDHILSVLQQVGGSRRRAIEILGISERTLRYKLRQWREQGFEIPD